MADVETKYPETLEDWVNKLSDVVFPMFPRTIKSLKNLTDEDINRSVDRFCADMLLDPGAAIGILRRANGGRRRRLGAQVPTVENAAMMIGMTAMRELYKDVPSFTPPGTTPPERGYMHVVARAYHAGYQAYDWAIQRGDMTPKEVFVAAFLYDLGEMVLWLYGGEPMMRVRELVLNEHMPEDEAQYMVLGFSQEQIGHELAKLWNLPEMVIECLQPEKARNPRALSVMLAAKLARLADTNWYTQEMLECMQSVADLLDISFDEVVRRSHQNALAAARETEFYQIIPAAAWLPMHSEDWSNKKVREQSIEDHEAAHFCLSPQLRVYDKAMIDLATLIKDKPDLNQILQVAMRGFHDGIGLNRVVFAMLSPDRTTLTARQLIGTDNDPVFNRFHVDIDLDRKDIFTQLFQKPRSVWVNAENRAKIWPLVPAAFKKLINTDSFFAMSVFIHDKPLGTFYADRHTHDSELDIKSYERFKRLCGMVSKGIERTREHK